MPCLPSPFLFFSNFPSTPSCAARTALASLQNHSSLRFQMQVFTPAGSYQHST